MLQSYAIVSDGKGDSQLKDIEVREPLDNEVLVEIKAAGICQTDLNKIKSLGETFIPGHEGAGLVQAIGSGVSKFKVGDRVALNWAQPCLNCYQCQLGNQNLCTENSPIVGKSKYFNKSLETSLFHGGNIPRLFNLGTFSKHTLVKESALTKIDNDISFQVAGILSCSVLTGYGSVVRAANVLEGSTVAIIGCGGIGINVIQSSVLRKAKKIIAIDNCEERLNLTENFGSTHQLLVAKDDLNLEKTISQVLGLTQERGADYCFECTGIPELAIIPLAMIRNGGTAIQISGVEESLVVDMNLFEFDKKYINPLYGSCIPENDIEILLSHYRKKEFKLEEQISNVSPIKDFQKLFKQIEKKEIVKGVLIMD